MARRASRPRTGWRRRLWPGLFGVAVVLAAVAVVLFFTTRTGGNGGANGPPGGSDLGITVATLITAVASLISAIAGVVDLTVRWRSARRPAPTGATSAQHAPGRLWTPEDGPPDLPH